MNPELVTAIVGVVIGTVAGGITNAVAVWMLFRPYEAPSLFGLRLRFLQGAIPKNKVRLAAAIGKTVGTKLLTGEDLARTVSEPSFRAGFDERLTIFLNAALERERGSLHDLMSPGIRTEIEAVLDGVLDNALQRLGVYIESDEFRDHARTWAENLAREMKDQPLGENLLTPEREAAIATAASRWMEELVESEAFARAIHDYLERGTERLLVPGRTFQEILPQGLVASLERAIAGYLPIAIEKLGGMLDDPAAKARVERVLHELLDRFMADLKFHQRLVAALFVTPDMVDRVLKAIEKDGAAKIAEILRDNDMRDAMARGVNNAVVDFLAKPVTSVLGNPGDESVESAKATIGHWLLTAARDDQTRRFVIEKLVDMLSKAEDRTWGDIFQHLPPERMADGIVQLARSDRAGELYRDAGERIVRLVLTRKLGRLSDYLPEGAPRRLEEALADPLWTWVQEQVPPIAARVNIAQKVEQKILDYPVAQVEALIKGVTERELRLIVQLGYVLGAFIGIVSAVIGLIF